MHSVSVVEFVESGAHPILRVARATTDSERLIPWVAQYVDASMRRRGGSTSTGRWITDGDGSMRIDVVTLFPGDGGAGMRLRHHRPRAGARVVAARRLNPRDFATDAYRTIDDRPYGGGPGMVLMAAPLARALDAARDAQVGVQASRARGRCTCRRPARR